MTHQQIKSECKQITKIKHDLNEDNERIPSTHPLMGGTSMHMLSDSFNASINGTDYFSSLKILFVIDGSLRNITKILGITDDVKKQKT